MQFSSWFLGPLLKTGLPLIGAILKPLAKNVLIPFGLTATASQTEAVIHKKMFGPGFTTLTISNEEMENIMKIFKSLVGSSLLIKRVREAFKNEAKEQEGGFLGMLLGILGARLLGNLLTGKCTIRAGKGAIRESGQFSMPPHPLTNFEIKKYYESESKLNGVYSKNNLHKERDRTYIINLDEYESTGTYWIAFYFNDNNVTYFESFGVEHIPKEIRKFIGNKNIIKNIYRIQAYDSIIWGYPCIAFIDLMLKGKSLLEYINLFSLNDYEENDKMILKYFQ